MKYVMFEDDVPVLFPESVPHGNMVFNLAVLGEPVSAGFVKVYDDGGIDVYGMSISLALESREEDHRIIKNHLGFEKRFMR